MPGVVNVKLNEAPCARSPESKAPVVLVAVCTTGSSFVHVTVSPAVIVSIDGEKAKSAIVTACVAARASSIDPSTNRINAASSSASAPRRAVDAGIGQFTSLGTACG